jgi:hypothetical protein
MIEGKLVNQYPSLRFGGVICSHCKKILPSPIRLTLFTKSNLKGTYYLFSYIGTPYLIYESKKGTATTYCNIRCAKKHNHRFHKR